MSTYINQMTQDELMASEPWPEDATLYTPYEVEQALLPEYASCFAVRCFLNMSGLDYKLEYYSNAEYMAPAGRMTKLPILRAGAFIMSEFEPIVSFVQQKQGIMGHWLNEDERADMHTYVSLVENIFTMAEYWLSFVNQDVYKQITVPRISYCYPWPLSKYVTYKKRNQAMRLLRVYQWHDMTLDEVIQKVDRCCETLSHKLGNNYYFCGDNPCELDAVVFGHLFAILTTNMPNMALQKTIKRYQVLVDFCERLEVDQFKTRTLMDLNEIKGNLHKQF